jgi:hypothetical protein
VSQIRHIKKRIKKLPLSSPITDQIQLSIGIGDEERSSDGDDWLANDRTLLRTAKRGRPKNMSHHLAEEMIASPIGAKFAETPWQSQHLRGVMTSIVGGEAFHLLQMARSGW